MSRRAHVSKVCRQYKLDAPGTSPNSWEFLINKKYHLVWCNVFKAASSSWLYVFNILGGYRHSFLSKTKSSPIQLARKRYARPYVAELNKALANSFSFMIVREPFERLLSAYRNKLENFRHKYYRKTARLIMTKFRKPNQNRAVKGPTFSEFIDYIIDLYRTGKKFDEHWALFYKFCTPCQVNFTVIAKTETMEDDEMYILAAANISQLVQPQRKNVAPGNESTSALVNHYYSQLSPEQLTNLYNIYHIDFQMFQYDPSKYFNLVNMSFNNEANYKV